MKHQVFIIILYSKTFTFLRYIFETEEHKVIPINGPELNFKNIKYKNKKAQVKIIRVGTKWYSKNDMRGENII